LREKDKSSVQYAKTPPLCFGCCTLFGSLRNREPRNTAKEECAAMAAVDDDLAAVGHDSEDGEVHVFPKTLKHF
jgi:hypothetical protein